MEWGIKSDFPGWGDFHQLGGKMAEDEEKKWGRGGRSRELTLNTLVKVFFCFFYAQQQSSLWVGSLFLAQPDACTLDTDGFFSVYEPHLMPMFFF